MPLVPPERPAGVTCPEWEPSSPGSKRCAHYNDDGHCSRPTQFMCVEWLRFNANKPAAPAEPPAVLHLTHPQPLPAKPKTASPAALREIADSGIGDRVFIPAKEIDPARVVSLASNVEEIQLAVPYRQEPIFLVPKLTGKDRLELTFEDCATIRLFIDAFPGSHVVDVQRTAPLPPSAGAPPDPAPLPPETATATEPDPFEL